MPVACFGLEVSFGVNHNQREWKTFSWAFYFYQNSAFAILSARGLAHSERQRNVKNVTLRNTELHNTKKAIYFTTSKITFMKHPKK